MTELRQRTAVRVLPIDHRDRLLLLHGFDPAEPDRPYWFTVGGGIEPGESAVIAALRELTEEAGVAVGPDDLVGPLAEDTAEFSFQRVRYRQDQTYFAVRIGDAAISLAGLDPIEHSSIVRYGWWSIDDLTHTTEQIYPDDLAHLLSRSLTLC